MFDYTKPARTKDGREARFLDKIENKEYPLVYVIISEDGEEDAETFTVDGFLYSRDVKNSSNLENIPEKHVYYLNIYSIGKRLGPFEAFSSKYEADGMRGSDCIACIRVEFEDGQYDE